MITSLRGTWQETVMIEQDYKKVSVVIRFSATIPWYLYLRLRLGHEGAAAGADSFSGSTALFFSFLLVAVVTGGTACLFVTGVRGASMSPSVKGLPGVIGLGAAYGKVPVWGGAEGRGEVRRGTVVNPPMSASKNALGLESAGADGHSGKDACMVVMQDCIWARSLSMMLAGQLTLDALEPSASFFPLECAQPFSLPNSSLRMFKSSLKVKDVCMIPTCSTISINCPSIQYQLHRR